MTRDQMFSRICSLDAKHEPGRAIEQQLGDLSFSRTSWAASKRSEGRRHHSTQQTLERNSLCKGSMRQELAA